MANNYNEILALANKNNMGLSNTIKRDYGIPLDYSSVQESYEAALAYAQTSTLAYIGQPISVGDTLYIVTDEANGYLKAVGTKPTGDEQSITIGEDGKVSIKGFEAAANATLPQKQADGSIAWVGIDAIVEGDGNTKTVVKAADDSDITVTPSYDEESDTYTYTLDVTLPAVPEYSVTKEDGEGVVTYRVTKDGVAVGEDIVVPDAYDDSALDARVADVETDVEDHEGRIADVEEKVDAFFGAVEEPDAIIDTLVEIQKYITDDKDGAAGMAQSIKANEDAIKVLNGDGAGSVKKAVDDAVAAQAATDAENYATKTALEEVKATADAAAKAADVEEALADKADRTDLEDFYTKDESYNKEAIDALLAGIKGEYGETADSVAAALETHKSESTTKFNTINTKNAEQDEAIQGLVDAIDIINSDTIGILANAKKDAQAKVTALENGKVADNTAAIIAVDAKITTANERVTALATDLGNLQEADSQLADRIAVAEGKHTGLATTVSEHTLTIAALESKDEELAEAIAVNTSKFESYSTTTQVAQLIEDRIAEISYTDITDAVEANAEAIAAEVSRAEAEEARIAALVDANADAIEDLDGEITRVNNVLVAALENDAEGLDSIKELATWVAEHETEVLPAIRANKEALDVLNGTGEGSVQKIVNDAIEAIPEVPLATALVAGLVKASGEVNVAEDGTMSIGTMSTDKLVQGTNTLVLNGGNAAVQA